MSEGSVAWKIVATAFVLLMTPALGFFYGGLVRSKNVLNTMMMSFAAVAVVGLVWALIGYTLAFSAGLPFVGGLSHALLRGVDLQPNGAIPHVLFMCFQGTFAIITAALISGAVVERMHFGPYLAFLALWAVLVYAPIAHWVWGGGWLADLGALDFAGGTVVHVNAGVAAVVAALVLGKRRDYGRQAILPHNIPLTLLGAMLLWLGWFGFNAGSALAANEIAGLAFTNTMLAPMATALVWMMLDLVRSGKATAVGVATAIVVGLVAITPAAGFVSPLSAIVLGALAALPSYFALIWRARTRLDDSLDVFGVHAVGGIVAAHGVGGLTGALLTGVFAEASWNGIADGLLFGNPMQVVIQAVAILAVVAYTAVATFVILRAIGLVTALRVSDGAERVGLDVAEHGEQAYTTGEGAVLLLPTARPSERGVRFEPAVKKVGGEA